MKKKQNTKVLVNLIDADPIVYEACFVAEAKEKEGVYLNEYQVFKVVDTIMRAIFRHTPMSTHYKPYLTIGKDNFRLKRATTLPYKGERKKDKPFFYDKVRDYLVKHWNAQLVSGVEADDALTIAKKHHEAKGIKCMISSIDKDLDQEEGLHYNPKRKQVYEIDYPKAQRNLWKQVIIGDPTTDNIPGLSHAYFWDTIREGDSMLGEPREKQYGPARAKRILDEAKGDDYATRILNEYVDVYGYDGEERTIQHGIDRFYETYDLVYMLREAPEGVKIAFDYLPIRRDDLGFEEENHSSLEF